MFNKQLLLNQVGGLKQVGRYRIQVQKRSVGYVSYVGFNLDDEVGSCLAQGEAPQLRLFYTLFYGKDPDVTFIRCARPDQDPRLKGMIILREDTPYIIQSDEAPFYIEAGVFRHQDIETTVTVALSSYN